jgi:hypothetical protein
MKKLIAVFVLSMVCTALADVVTLPTNCWLNVTTRDTTTHYTPDQMCSQSPNIPYNFFWTYYDNSTCLCPCMPCITVGSPYPFYISKHPMNGSLFFNIAQLQDTTVFFKCSTATNTLFTNHQLITGCKMSTRQIDCTDPKARDTLCTRLFVFQNAHNAMFVPVRIQTMFCRGSSGNGCVGEIIDSIAVAYGISTPVKTPAVVQPPLAPVYRHAVIILDGKQMRIDGVYYNVNGKRISAAQKLYHGILLEKIGNQ